MPRILLQHNIMGDEVNIDLNINPPSFYLAAAHGSGSLSFLYYLFMLQLPCIRKTFNFRALFEFQQYEKIGVYVEDSYKKTDIEEFFLKNQAPVLWLLRDPIALLCTDVNLSVQISILRFLHHNNPVEFKNISASEALRARILETPEKYCSYSSQLKKIPHIENILAIDTLDLSKDVIQHTMKRVCDFLKITPPVLNKEKLSTSFGSYWNRLEWLVPPIKIKIGATDIFIYTYPEEKNEFAIYTMLVSYNIVLRYLFTDIVCGRKYVISTRAEDIKKLKNKILMEENKAEIRRIIAMRRDVLESMTPVFQKYKITPQDILEIIYADKKLLLAFLKSQRGELELVEKFFPALIKRWNYFAELVALPL